MRLRARLAGGASAEDAGAGAFGELGELVNFARKYQSEDYPNAARYGCPPTSALRTLIRSGELPGLGVRAHLFGCSECFRLYRTLLEAHREQPRANATSRLRALLRALWEGYVAKIESKQGVLRLTPQAVLQESVIGLCSSRPDKSCSGSGAGGRVRRLAATERPVADSRPMSDSESLVAS